MSEITEKSKVIADYLGWRYVPSNDLQGFPKAGWWKGNCNTKEGISYNKINSGCLYVCRNHNQLRFYNSFDALIPAIEKLEKEDLSDYIKNFEYIEFVRDNFTSEIQLLSHPKPMELIGESKDKGIIKDTFYAVYQAIEYINNLKENYEN